MAFNGLTLKYSLEGTSNFIAWKDHMEEVLNDNGFLEYVKTYIPIPLAVDVQDLESWKEDLAKARRIILEGVQDHIVSNLLGKETPFMIWKALIELFENSSDHRNLALKDKIQSIKMQKNDTIPQYLSRFTQCFEELGKVCVTILEDDLVSVALMGLPKSWQNYQDSVN